MVRKNRTPEENERRAKIRELLQMGNISSMDDIQSLFKETIAEFMENGLEAELDDELGYSKYDYRNKNTDNSRNGHSTKRLRTSFGDAEISVPRDRKGEFEPQILKKNQTSVSQDIEEKILSMYAKGMTTSDMSVEERREKLRQCIVGWVNYFGMADMKATARALDEWLRRRIRMCYWKQWKKISAKRDNLVKLGLDERKAREYANTRKGYWHTANSPILTRTLTNERLRKIGFITVSERYSMTHSSC